MNRILSQTIGFSSGLLGLTFLSYLTGQPVTAANLACSTGVNWVSTCQAGYYQFNNDLTNFLNVFSSNNQPDLAVFRSGMTYIVLSDPVDALVNDPSLGDVGTIDGSLDVVKLEIYNSVSTGIFPSPNPYISSVFQGDGVPDLASTPPDDTVPYESLYSAGAIVQRQDDPTLAESFVNVFLSAPDLPEGELRNHTVLSLSPLFPLTTFFSSNGNNVTYTSASITPLLTAGPDDQFWTGDETEFARLVPGPEGFSTLFTLSPVSVPEPEPSMANAFLLLGLGVLERIKRNFNYRPLDFA